MRRKYYFFIFSEKLLDWFSAHIFSSRNFQAKKILQMPCQLHCSCMSCAPYHLIRQTIDEATYDPTHFNIIIKFSATQGSYYYFSLFFVFSIKGNKTLPTLSSKKISPACIVTYAPCWYMTDTWQSSLPDQPLLT